LFISGGQMPKLADPHADDFVQKPFAFHELVGCVWELHLRDNPNDPDRRIICVEPEMA
jgi:DNA-binding response OmpR family regulator